MAEGFVEYALDQLAQMGEVRAKAMFGGHGIYHGETFFAIVHDGRLYLKVDDATRGAFEEAGMGPFRPYGKQTMASYYEVPGDVLEDEEELVIWARRAVDVARS
ncbi:MAG: TfoX/Sxy family protein [Candidatus Thermoplasmatota archaeon]|nr:TfoX/Sxy family protein [Candidatus Thermoplasmatota archaeon]